ncbi:hypothetical protein [Frankia nepalensis]|uniref:hypothetical protein n=1 Tax=Frankia nepalensis TaxID=1836974 RepID=UPI001EE42863|nr:hypothetical protein [Frankia nepalensis]
MAVWGVDAPASMARQRHAQPSRGVSPAPRLISKSSNSAVCSDGDSDGYSGCLCSASMPCSGSTPVVVRVGRSVAYLDAARRELAVSDWLTAGSVPVV